MRIVPFSLAKIKVRVEGNQNLKITSSADQVIKNCPLFIEECKYMEFIFPQNSWYWLGNGQNCFLERPLQEKGAILFATEKVAIGTTV